MKFTVILSLIAVLFSVSGVFGTLCALEREGNISIHILLDRSLSMEGEIENAKNYIMDDIIDKTLIPGDTITVIEFYRTPGIVFSETVSAEKEKEPLTAEIELIRANRGYTDIGKALDFLVEHSLPREENVRTHTILLSDLKQEAPADSPYAGTVEDFSHVHLTPKKEMRQNGWRILIIGPEIEEKAEGIAREVVSVRSKAE
ncbi:MAG: VWA domain-containing protein [Sediminispirochaetaceae bacterium]